MKTIIKPMTTFSISQMQRISKINSMFIAMMVLVDFTQEEMASLNLGDKTPLISKKKRESAFRKEFKRLQKEAAQIIGKEQAFMFFGYSSNYKTKNRLYKKYCKGVSEHNAYVWMQNQNKL